MRVCGRGRESEMCRVAGKDLGRFVKHSYSVYSGNNSSTDLGECSHQHLLVRLTKQNRCGEMYSPTLAGEVDKIEQISGKCTHQHLLVRLTK